MFNKCLQFLHLNYLPQLVNKISFANKSKVLHFGIQGNVFSKSGKYTLAFTCKSSGEYAEPDDLATVIDSCCACDDGTKRSSIEFVVLNAPYTTKIEEILKLRHSVFWLVIWKTEVDNEAMKTFTETFYQVLSIEEGSDKYRN